MIYIGISSNIGNRINNLRKSINLLKEHLEDIKCSIILETKAILPQNAPAEWDIPFLNIVVSGTTKLSPHELLQGLKNIETSLGRPKKHEKWGPRKIDLDILLYDDLILKTPNLTIPHTEIANRDFLCHLLALMHVEPWKSNINKNNCFLKSFILNPQIVGVVNITPNSFSDGGNFFQAESAISHIYKLANDGASIVEIGAQATNPYVTDNNNPIEEYNKLKFILDGISPLIKNESIDISIDTFNPEVALKILQDYNIKLINDVKGNFDDHSLNIIANSGCKFCFMHSITVPPLQNKIIPTNIPPIKTLINWAKDYIQRLLKLGFSLNNIILDPGIGFGKSIYQNLELLQQIKEFKNLETLIMVGHSRKSFISSFSSEVKAIEKDIETIGISIFLKDKVDFLRVHNVIDHMKALVAYNIMTS